MTDIGPCVGRRDKVELKDELSVDGNSLTVEDLVQAARGNVSVSLLTRQSPE